MAATGETFAAKCAAGAAAKKADSSVTTVLVTRCPHLPEAFSARSLSRCAVSCARNISGESWFNTAPKIPFADSTPSSIPTGMPHMHSSKISAATILYRCPLSAPIARSTPYCPTRRVTAIFKILKITSPAASKTSTAARTPASITNENPSSPDVMPSSSVL